MTENSIAFGDKDLAARTDRHFFWTIEPRPVGDEGSIQLEDRHSIIIGIPDVHSIPFEVDTNPAGVEEFARTVSGLAIGDHRHTIGREALGSVKFAVDDKDRSIRGHVDAGGILQDA